MLGISKDLAYDLAAGAPWVRRIPSHTATTRAAPVGSGSPRIPKAKRIADRRPGHGPHLGAGTGEEDEVLGDGRRFARQGVEASPGAPRAPLGPVAAVALKRVGRPRLVATGQPVAAFATIRALATKIESG
jgi:hypothetical protein